MRRGGSELHHPIADVSSIIQVSIPTGADMRCVQGGSDVCDDVRSDCQESDGRAPGTFWAGRNGRGQSH